MVAKTLSPKLSVLCALFAALVISNSCNQADPANSPTLAVTDFAGVTNTDSTGIITSIDPDDWKPFSVGNVEFILHAAYPNPCTAGKGFSFAWYQQSRDSVLITLNDSPSHLVTTFIAQTLDSGQYVFHNRLDNFQPAIYRLYFRIVRPDSIFTSYGDIEVD